MNIVQAVTHVESMRDWPDEFGMEVTDYDLCAHLDGAFQRRLEDALRHLMKRGYTVTSWHDDSTMTHHFRLKLTIL